MTEKLPFAFSPLPNLTGLPGLSSWGTTAGRYQFIITNDTKLGWSGSWSDMQVPNSRPQSVAGADKGRWFKTMAECADACRSTYDHLPKSSRHELVRLFAPADPEYKASTKMLHAHSQNIHVCDLCDNIHLTFYDAGGQGFADATVSIQQVDDMAQRLQKYKQHIIMRTKTEGLRS
jgi:hypothetical protein